jgi:tight adherence protein C
MSPILLVAAFFLTIMGLITVTGYLVLSRRTAGAPSGPVISRSIIENTLLRVGEAIPSKSSQVKRSQKKLILAGYRQANAPEVFLGVKIAFMAALTILFGATKLFIGGDVGIVVLAMCAGAGLGFMIPDRLLEHAIRKRSQKILFGIPSAIDLLVLSLEAGQSLDASLADTARELRQGYPELSSELTQVQVELPASRTRAEVFRALADRNVEPELKRLAQVFLDSDRFGTSLAPALRSHVKYLRVRLRQQAYEQARKVSVKLVFPVFFLIFPSVILVTLGPALIQVFTQLSVLQK